MAKYRFSKLFEYRLVFFLLLFFAADIKAFDVYSGCMHLASNQVANSLDPESGLSPEELSFYQKLPSDKKRAFLAMSEDRKQAVLDLSVKVSPSVALSKATDYEIQTLDAAQQALYRRLSDKERLIYFLISDEASREAVEWAKRVSADQAVEQALQVDLNTFIPEQLNFFQQLTPDNQLVYLALSSRVQENLVLNQEAGKDPNKAVLAAQTRDAARLYPEQYAFYQALGERDRIIYLSLTPDTRGIAVALTQGLDPSDAVGYIAALPK